MTLSCALGVPMITGLRQLHNMIVNFPLSAWEGRICICSCAGSLLVFDFFSFYKGKKIVGGLLKVARGPVFEP